MDANDVLNILMNVYGIHIDEIIEIVDRIEVRDYDTQPVIFLCKGRCNLCHSETDHNVFMLLEPKHCYGNTSVEICGECMSLLRWTFGNDA